MHQERQVALVVVAVVEVARVVVVASAATSIVVEALVYSQSHLQHEHLTCDFRLFIEY